MKVGVLAVQGAFAEHMQMLKRLRAETVPVRLPGELEGLDGLILPGGESTSIGKLMREYGLVEPVREMGADGLPIMGTCAGMIVLARKAVNYCFEPLKLIDITVVRNAFGRQKESFETELDIPALGDEPFPGIFIRAPLIESMDRRAEPLARLSDGTTVAARQGKVLVAAFHPELADDTRFHSYFLDVISGAG